MWEWASIRPGKSVADGRSISVPPAGAFNPAAGPAASILAPTTRTAQASCIVSPSNTRAGLRTKLEAAGGGSALSIAARMRRQK